MKKTLVLITVILIITTVKAQESTITGSWQLYQVVQNGQTEKDLKPVFIFAEKGILKAARNAISKPAQFGTWKYNKKEKIIVMTSELDRDFNGEAKVIKLNKNELEYNKDGAILSFKKIEKTYSPPVITMEKPELSFVLEDMLDEENSFDYGVESIKLPWNIETIVNFLKEQNEVVYNVTSFTDGQDPDVWIQSSKINYNEAEQTIDVREYAPVENEYIDMNEDPILMNELEYYQEYFHFFPKENLDYYKVVGQENVETPAGVFECTVVEGFGRFNAKVQYWMINNKPGVFAKVINVQDAPPPYGSTKVYVLKEIK